MARASALALGTNARSKNFQDSFGDTSVEAIGFAFSRQTAHIIRARYVLRELFEPSEPLTIGRIFTTGCSPKCVPKNKFVVHLDEGLCSIPNTCKVKRRSAMRHSKQGLVIFLAGRTSRTISEKVFVRCSATSVTWSLLESTSASSHSQRSHCDKGRNRLCSAETSLSIMQHSFPANIRDASRPKSPQLSPDHREAVDVSGAAAEDVSSAYAQGSPMKDFICVL